jgi:hypothetical protein
MGGEIGKCGAGNAERGAWRAGAALTFLFFVPQMGRGGRALEDSAVSQIVRRQQLRATVSGMDEVNWMLMFDVMRVIGKAPMVLGDRFGKKSLPGECRLRSIINICPVSSRGPQEIVVEKAGTTRCCGWDVKAGPISAGGEVPHTERRNRMVLGVTASAPLAIVLAMGPPMLAVSGATVLNSLVLAGES